VKSNQGEFRVNSQFKKTQAFHAMRFFGIALAAALFTTVSFADLVPKFSKTIDSMAKKMIADGAAPAISIAVMQGSEIIHAKGYGLVDIDKKEKARTDHIYRIGSVTKQFTAAAIMQLVEQGKIRLDDPLTNFFPEFPSPGEKVTVYHLLGHTSGIKSFTNLASYPTLAKEPVTHDSLIGRFINEPFDFQPGEEFQYNNSAYYLLGVIIEKVSGRSYAEYLQKFVYAPAGLKDTAYGADDYPTPRHARGYMAVNRKPKAEQFLSMTQPFSAGSLESTVEDLMRWQIALRSGKVVSPESYRLMTTPGRLNSGEQTGYGFGLFVRQSEWRRTIQHGGGIHGFTCALNYYPDEDVTLALLTNSRMGKASTLAHEIQQAIFTENAPRKVDTLIKGGTVIDGTGRERKEADVAVHQGKIVAIGDLEDIKAAKTINAKGLIVAPGFIDVHNHSDNGIASDRNKLNEGYVTQGVSTIVGGADGGRGPREIKNQLAMYEKNGIATNVAFYVGHNMIRRQVMKSSQQREPSPDELDQMRALVREGMDMGAVGLSTGLMYEPGMYATTEEVTELAKEVTAYNGTYDSHVRNPVRDFLASHTEASDIGRGATIPSKLGHLKGVGLQNAGVINDVIAMVEDQRAQGHVVVSDQYPYDGAATAQLREIVVVPRDFGKDFELHDLLRDPDKRNAIREASENGVDGGFAWIKATGYKAMRIVSSEDYPDLVGSYLSELADQREQKPFDVVADLLLNANSIVRITLGAIKEEDVRTLLVQPWNMIASDGSYVNPKGRGEQAHPRSTGTFPRVLGHYVRDEKLLTLEEAVHKMTGLPARYLGLSDRGRIHLGVPADITIFDPKAITANSTWDEPGNYATGVKHLLVNGTAVLKDGKLTGETPGKYLTKS
jgi:N-acyl-D-aspartate/D-glutamate deacylase/CubicO group peptidase (beta-lactamase class C family)